MGSGEHTVCSQERSLVPQTSRPRHPLFLCLGITLTSTNTQKSTGLTSTEWRWGGVRLDPLS